MYGDNIMDDFWWIVIGFACFWAITFYIRNYTGERAKEKYRPMLFPPAIPPPPPPRPNVNVVVNMPPLDPLTPEQIEHIQKEFRKKFTNIDYRTIYTGRISYNPKLKEGDDGKENTVQKTIERKITFK